VGNDISSESGNISRPEVEGVEVKSCVAWSTEQSVASALGTGTRMFEYEEDTRRALEVSVRVPPGDCSVATARCCLYFSASPSEFSLGGGNRFFMFGGWVCRPRVSMLNDR
jgi:hypothetical protein